MLVALAYNDSPSYVAQHVPGPYTNAQLAAEWLKWVAELGGTKDFDLVLMRPPNSQIPDAVDAWRSVRHFTERNHIKAWPLGPNTVWSQMVWILYDIGKKDPKLKVPFLWIEPDCIPLKAGWLSTIATEYEVGLAQKESKPFMGTIVPADPKQRCPTHMTGNAVYPYDLMVKAPLLNPPRWSPGHPAWDVFSAEQVVPRCHSMNHLLFHWWRHPAPATLEELENRVKPSTVLYHADKELKLIPLLREKLSLSGRALVPEFKQEESEAVDFAKKLAAKLGSKQRAPGELREIISAIQARSWNDGEVQAIVAALTSTYGK